MSLSYQGAEIDLLYREECERQPNHRNAATNSRGSEEHALVDQRFRKRGR